MNNIHIKNRYYLQKLLCLILSIILLLAFLLTGCSSSQKDIITGDDNPSEPYSEVGTDFSKYTGSRMGVTTGTIQEKYVNEKIPGGICAYYDDYPAMAVALNQGKIDAFIMAYKPALELLANNPNLTFDPIPIGIDWISQIFSKTAKGEKLQSEFTAFINKISENGELDQLNDKWADSSKWTAPDYSRIENNTEIIKYGTLGLLMPYCFMGDGEYIGLELDLMIKFCEEYGYKFDMDIMPVPSLLLAISTGVLDMCGGGLVYSEERAQSALFGPSYYTSTQVIIIPKASSVSKDSFIDGFENEFEKTFITQSRWKLFAEGIKTTFLITICAFVLGAIIGIGICRLLSSKSEFSKGIAYWYTKIMQGIPAVVILMVLCYVVFSQIHISEVLVAIIGFALLVGSETGELYYRSINSVGIGQKEASLSIGLTPYQTFIGIVLPQARKSILQGYKNCFISLMKSTSIAGYIAVQDLTKMTDIVRSRTYSAFFPLISTAIIYFIVSFLIAKLLERIIEKAEPDRKNRKIKGVKIHD